MADILQRLTTTLNSGLGNIGRQNNQFKQVAQQQNSSIMGFMKDIGRYFNRQSQQQSSLNNSLSEINQNTNLNSQKIEQSNVLLKDSIGILGQLLSETKQMSENMFKLVNLTESGQGSFGQSQENSTTNSMLSRIMSFLGIGAAAAAGGAAATIGLDALGGSVYGGETIGKLQEGLDRITNLVTNPGGNYGGPATSGVGGGTAVGGGGGFSDTDGGRDNGGGNKLSVADMVKLAKEAGFNDEQAAIMGAIGAAESSGNPSAHNPNASTGDNSYGLWQINMLGKLEGERKQLFGISDNEQLKDPKVNAVAAKKIYDQQGFNAWSVYKSGAYRKYLGTAMKSAGLEKDDSMAPHGTLVEKDSPPIGNNMTGGGGGSVQERQAQIAGIRKLPLSPQMRSVLERAAAATGVQAVVYSGGQPPKGSGGARTGSTRHDNGNAADLWLEKDGRKLADTNPQDKAIMAKFVSAAVQAGATGVGAGHGYMGPSNIHVGFGKQATWGGADWIKQAASGIFNNKDMTGSGEGGSGENYDPGDRSGAQMVGGGDMMGGGGMPGMGMGLPGLGMMGMIPGMGGGLPAAAMIGGGLFGMAMSALSGISSAIGSSNSNRPETKTKRNNIQEKNVEGDDTIAALSPPKEPPAIKSIRSAAISNDLSMTNLSQTMQAQQQSSSQQQNYGSVAPKNSGDTRSGYQTTGPTSSTAPWYMQLAGRLDYSESMKMFKGGVIT